MWKHALLILSLAPAWAQLPTDAASLQAGKKAYEWHCAFCHGAGSDGFAANLASPRLTYAPTDTSLMNIIRTGISGTGMPPALGMSDVEIRQVAGYVRSLGRTAPQKVPGDAAKGKALYSGKGGCAACHMTGGAGGRMGPDLSDIGIRRAPVSLRTSIVNADAVVVPGWAQVNAELSGGGKVSGVRLNEDTFSIQIRDASGKIHSLAKSRITKLEKNAAKSTMPSYEGKLSGSEIDDIVAFLFSLRGGL